MRGDIFVRRLQMHMCPLAVEHVHTNDPAGSTCTSERRSLKNDFHRREHRRQLDVACILRNLVTPEGFSADPMTKRHIDCVRSNSPLTTVAGRVLHALARMDLNLLRWAECAGIKGTFVRRLSFVARIERITAETDVPSKVG